MTSLGAAQRLWLRHAHLHPVRWWLTDDDWTALRASIDAASLHKVDLVSCRLFGLPISFDRTGQPSRLVLADGTALPLELHPSNDPSNNRA